MIRTDYQKRISKRNNDIIRKWKSRTQNQRVPRTRIIKDLAEEYQLTTGHVYEILHTRREEEIAETAETK